jgi:hypothetical protein
MLGRCIVYRDDRKAQRLIRCQCSGAHDASGGLLKPTQHSAICGPLVQGYNQVGAIIHYEMRLNSQRLFKVALIGGEIFSVGGIHGNTACHERGTDIIAR